MIPDKCKTYLGPSYVLLREEFYKAKQEAKVRDGNVKCVLVFFGGSDHTNQTLKVIEAIPLLNRPDIVFDIVVGASNQHKETLERLICDIPNANYHCQVSNIASLMVKADLAIGAGGATTWERCVLGLPTLTIVFADNQFKTTQDLAAINVIQFLGWSGNLSNLCLLESLQTAIDRPKDLTQMSENSLKLMNCESNSITNLIKDLTLVN